MLQKDGLHSLSGRPAEAAAPDDAPPGGRQRVRRKFSEQCQDLKKLLLQVIQALSITVEIRDPYIHNHQERVARMAVAIARELGLPREKVNTVRTAATIHDIGKIRIPSEILSKPGKIDESEFNIIKTHSQAGFDILNKIDFLWPIAQIVLQHHERINGTGYPAGITGEQILLESKILAVADVVEAMVSHRPYRPALGLKKALAEIAANRNVLYDSAVVDACIRISATPDFADWA